MKTILITGTSTGIGNAAAALFLEKGYKVYGIDILETTIGNPNYTHFQCDISCGALPEITEEINYVVNNAGTSDTAMAIATNLQALFRIEDKYVTPNTKCVVNLGSTSAHIGIESREYAASKAGVLGYTRQLAKKMGEWGGRAVSISPGPVLTDMNKSVLDSPQKRRAVADENLLKKWIEPREIAEAMLFMCQSGSITGVDLLIDCGEHINHNEIK
jgi:NAD(P)-dependent dehydrogenase (short-subunit alcohol dehydrogenase family)